MRTTMAMMLMVTMACSTTEQNQARLSRIEENAKSYVEHMQATLIAAKCWQDHSGYRCDVRTREAGFLPLFCGTQSCHMLDW